MSKRITYELHVSASNKTFVPSVIPNISGNLRLSFPSNPLKFIIFIIIRTWTPRSVSYWQHSSINVNKYIHMNRAVNEMVKKKSDNKRRWWKHWNCTVKEDTSGSSSRKVHSKKSLTWRVRLDPNQQKSHWRRTTTAPCRSSRMMDGPLWSFCWGVEWLTWMNVSAF